MKILPPSMRGRIGSIVCLISLSLLFSIVQFELIRTGVVVGNSMEPTFHDGDYILYERISILLSGPKRGDVIVVDQSFLSQKDDFEQENGPFIKRVAGLPNESILVEDDIITRIAESKKNGSIIYQAPNMYNARYSIDYVQLSRDEYFVIGDNPKASADSRDYGPIPRSKIIGRAICLLPFRPLNKSLKMENFYASD